MLHLHRSNRLEALADALAALISGSPPTDPFSRERVAVPSRGMERWLSQQLAARMGICAAIDFPFPERALDDVLLSIGGQTRPTADPWQPTRLIWHVLGVLPELRGAHPSAFEPLSRWLEADHVTGDAAEGARPAAATEAVGRRELLLAGRIADAFDRLITYRPDWLVAWERGHDVPPGAPAPLVEALRGDQRWQPLLWRALRERLDSPPLHERLEALEAMAATSTPDSPISSQIAATGAAGGSLPERLCFFGLSSLPPHYLRALERVAARVDVHLFVLSPSSGWWAESRTTDEEDAIPPLLGALGRLGRDFQAALEEVGYHEDGVDRYVEPCATAAQATSALRVLQSDLLHLRRRGDGGLAAETMASSGADAIDRSVRIHGCHGDTRQVEVLRDDLLALLDEDPTLEPRDIVVLTPDIERFAPIVEAVFSRGDGAPTSDDGRGGERRSAGFPRLPFSIADRAPGSENPVAAALVRLLELGTGRLGANDLLDLLALEPVRRRFDVAADELAEITALVSAAGVRWGLDADHRASFGRPRDGSHTWRFGLDRLLVGVAIADDDRSLWCGTLPVDDIEGRRVEQTGKIAALVEAVARHLERWRVPTTATSWWRRLAGALDDLTATTDDDCWIARQARDELDRLDRDAAEGLGERILDVRAVQALLVGRFAQVRSSRGLLAGGITFCAMVPMRAIPFRVVALLGLDDDSLPRHGSRQAFDLLAIAPRPGDRSRRDEDLYLVLEALLSARDHLRVLYAARDPRSNASQPPAVPIATLLDTIDATFAPTPTADDLDGLPSRPTRTARELLTTVHPLQAFSPRVFDGTAPLSFDRAMCAAAERLQRATVEAAPFCATPLPPPPRGPVRANGGEPRLVELADLESFLAGPGRYLLERRLGLRLGDSSTATEDREPIGLDGLGRYTVGTRLLTDLGRGIPQGRARAAAQASGLLPSGAKGQLLLDDLMQTAIELNDRVAKAIGGITAQQVPVDITLDLALGPNDATSSDSATAAGEARQTSSASSARSATSRWRLVGAVADCHRRADGSILHISQRFGGAGDAHRLALWLRHLCLHATAGEVAATSVVLLPAERGGQAGFAALAGPDRGERARTILARLVELFSLGDRVAVPLLARTSPAWATAWLKYAQTDVDEARRRAFAAAARTWLPPAFGGAPGERDDPWLARLYGGVLPVDPIELPMELFWPTPLDLHHVALTVWSPLLEATATEGEL